MPAFAAGRSPAVSAGREDDGATWKVERVQPEEGKPALPAEIPEAFAKLLDPAMLRLIPGDRKDGKPAVEIWLRRELPLPASAAQPAASSNVRHPKLPSGAFLGAMRTDGTTSDYREQEIPAGVHALRVFLQPTDGNHLGTSDSRDFVILTAFDHDKDPAPVATQDDLVALSVPISPSDHALVLYLCDPPSIQDPPSAVPILDRSSRFFRRGDKHEWALELHLPARAPDAEKTESLRFGLVLLGHTAG